MGKTQPLKELNQIQELKDYFLQKQERRNFLLVVMGLNTSLRISDILSLRWRDVYNFKRSKYRIHIMLREQKTGKNNMIAINNAIIEALRIYKEELTCIMPDLYLFKSRNGENRAISRNRAFHVIKNAALALGFEGNISCHSLRKTFGYQAWRKGVPPALLMSIYNHSSYEITKRYLDINQDERDHVFLEITL